MRSHKGFEACGRGRGERGRGGMAFEGRCRRMRHPGQPGEGGRARGARRGGGRVFGHGAMRWLLLSLIAEKPRHGYELIKQIEARMGGTYAPSPGVIYPSLTLLEDMGALVVEADGGKKLHVITDEGRRLLAENAATVAEVERRMAVMGARPERPSRVNEALQAFRLALCQKLRQETPLTPAQVDELETIIRQATDRITAL